MSEPTVRHIVGCMSGTSLDGIDLALVRITGRGLDMTAEYVAGRSEKSDSLSRLMRPLASAEALPAEQFSKLAYMAAMSHALGIRELLQEAKTGTDLISLHGQTIFHRPPLSWQLVNPWPIVEQIGVPVVYDLRGADIATGGEGAPITPIADHLLFRDAQETRVVLNLGGFANFTWLPPSTRTGADALTSIRGGDICACNQALDFIARDALDQPYDEGGTLALSGQVNQTAFDFIYMVTHVDSELAGSLGDAEPTLNAIRTMLDECDTADLLRTTCAVIAEVTAKKVGEADRLIVAGGGAFNAALLEELESRCAMPVETTERHGIPIAYREAVAMVILGALCADRVPITLPQVTGCATPTPLAGAWVFPNETDPAAVFA